MKRLLVFLLLFPSLAFAWPVVSVTDGDTIKILRNGQQVKIRLYGIDAPEKKQPYGQAAKRFLKNATLGKDIDIEEITMDRYGRTVAIVGNVNGKLVKNGLAWVYDRYCKRQVCEEWREDQQKARSLKIGLWQGNPMPPWEWRRKK